MTSKAEIAARIDEVFLTATSSTGSADLRSVQKVFWPILDNKISLVDIAGVFTMSVPGNGVDTLDLITFAEFFNGLARVKYTTGGDYCERLLAELENAKGVKISADMPLFEKTMDKAVIRTLLKFDMPLRRAFSGFAGQSINIGGGLTWAEVQKKSIGMEVSGFTSFAGAHSLIPSVLSLHKCENLARDVLSKFPLLGTAATLNSALLYPQFQFLLCITAVERQEARNKKNVNNKANFAKKTVELESRPLAELLADLIRDLGIDKSVNKPLDGMDMAIDHGTSPFGALPGGRSPSRLNGTGSAISLPGTVVLPSQDHPENQYTGTINHSKHAQLMRMENLFEEIEAKMLSMIPPGSDVLAMLSNNSLDDGANESKNKLTSKPVVIGDAVPVPAICPEPVEQLLQAALAHHNLGSFEEALKFMEASRMQLEDIAARLQANAAGVEEGGENNDEKEPVEKEDIVPQDVTDSGIPLDLELYITVCKGNVYQSCGDDEQSLLHYLDGWDRAVAQEDKDWEVVCLNSIGMLAYYSLRYDVALLCFASVAIYRAKAYGLNSADTATAWNNEAACMFCINKKGEARQRFEKSWATMCKVLGHRAPRSVTTWKNLEKARRAHSSMKSNESIQMRPDVDRLILGGSFLIDAKAPSDGGGGGKKKKGKKKK